MNAAQRHKNERTAERHHRQGQPQTYNTQREREIKGEREREGKVLFGLEEAFRGGFAFAVRDLHKGMQISALVETVKFNQEGGGEEEKEAEDAVLEWAQNGQWKE
jgi:hypothetical protein